MRKCLLYLVVAFVVYVGLFVLMFEVEDNDRRAEFPVGISDRMEINGKQRNVELYYIYVAYPVARWPFQENNFINRLRHSIFSPLTRLRRYIQRKDAVMYRDDNGKIEFVEL